LFKLGNVISEASLNANVNQGINQAMSAITQN